MSLPDNHEKRIQELDALREKVLELEASGVLLKQAEARLLASEKKYRTIFDNTGTATILIEADTTISMANNEFVKLTGYTIAEIEGGMTWVDFIHEADRERMIGYHYSRRIDPVSAPRNYECCLINRDGRKLTCSMTVAMIPETSQSIASFLDLTEAREAESALKVKDEQYRLLVETMSDGLGVQDERGIVTYVNNRICEILGYSKGELVGKRSFDFLSEGSKSTWQGEMIKRMVNRHEPYEVTWQNRIGEPVVTIVSPRPIFGPDGKYAGSFAVFTDITSRKKAEEALKISEEKFARAFRSSPAAIAISTLKEGLFLDVNDSFLKVTGFDRDEIIDHTSIEIRLWPSAEFRQGVMEQVQGKGGIKDLEIEFRIKSGELRKIVYSAESITLQGTPCLISLFTDVTEERRLEKEIIEIGERERQKVSQELHDDLQQHLIGVEALSLLLVTRMERDESAHAGLAQDLVDLIREAITKTRALARGLSPVYIDEAALFTAIRGLAKQVQGIFGVSMRLDVSRDIHVKDNATAVHIYRIIQEAVNNAVRHGKARHISIALRRKKTGLTLTISDDGAGMPDELDPKKGMGLSIMRHRARMIGAELTIENNSKGGVSIICRLAHES